MMIGALGDIHGDFASVRHIQAQHPEVPVWLCVGENGSTCRICLLTMPVACTGLPATLRSRWRTSARDSWPARNSS